MDSRDDKVDSREDKVDSQDDKDIQGSKNIYPKKDETDDLKSFFF